MSAFVALMGLRRYMRDHPSVPADEVADALQRSDADMAAADFMSALKLHDRFPDEIDFVEPKGSLRSCLSILIDLHRPWWCRFFPLGRQQLATNLSPDEHQTFCSAGLFEENPGPDIVEWWDALASLIRQLEGDRRTEQGREAERLSLDYERSRLKVLGIALEPKWVALENNRAGFDIQSYDKTEFGTKNLLIEVKSTQRVPPRMIISRGEWKAALVYGSAYQFHLWKLPSKELTVLSVDDLAVHVPIDQGFGKWESLEVEF